MSLGEVVQITATAQMKWKLAIGGEWRGVDRGYRDCDRRQVASAQGGALMDDDH